MAAIFTPKNGCSLQEVARISGFHHFNWINIVTQAPIDDLLFCTGLPFLPVVEPLPGGGRCSGWADDLPYFWNEFNQDGTASSSELSQWTTDRTLFFRDIPSWPFLAPTNAINFYTILVGVRYGSKFSVLSAFAWKTTYTGHETPSGGVDVLQEHLGVQELPQSIRRLLSEKGGDNVAVVFNDSFESGTLTGWNGPPNP
jgi:hypothetical protein